MLTYVSTTRLMNCYVTVSKFFAVCDKLKICFVKSFSLMWILYDTHVCKDPFMLEEIFPFFQQSFILQHHKYVCYLVWCCVGRRFSKIYGGRTWDYTSGSVIQQSTQGKQWSPQIYKKVKHLSRNADSYLVWTQPCMFLLLYDFHDCYEGFQWIRMEKHIR